MKQVITLLIATAVTLTSFATVKPANHIIKAEVINAIKKANTLSVNLKSAGKVNLTWNAAVESTTTSYQILKSVNGGQFKTIAILMGESNDSYTFRENVKDATGNIQYKVVLVDNNVVVKTITQGILIL